MKFAIDHLIADLEKIRKETKARIQADNDQWPRISRDERALHEAMITMNIEVNKAATLQATLPKLCVSDHVAIVR